MEDSRNRNLDVKDLVNTGLSNTEGNLYLVAEKTLERLEIQFIPTEIEIDPAPDIAAVVIVGRNEPRYQHIAGQTVLRMTLDFYADDKLRVEAIEKARWLQTMVARNGTTEAPQRLKLIFGDLFRDEVWPSPLSSSWLLGRSL